MLNKKNMQGNREKSNPKPSNQKKNQSNKKNNSSSVSSMKTSGNYTQFSSKIFKGSEYMEKFILEVESDKYAFKCMKCKDDKNKAGKILQVNSLKSHITSIEHKNNTPQGEFKDYEELKII